MVNIVISAKTLQSGKKLSDYNIVENSTLWIIVRAHGGILYHPEYTGRRLMLDQPLHR